ncbi:MAG: alpha/beta hydrolase [Rhodospirillales bacterium]
MPLDPEMQAIVDRANAIAATVANPFDVAVAREMFAKAGLANAPQPPAVKSVADHAAPGPHGPVPVRVYVPNGGGAGPLPAIVYFHGGGWVLGSVATHDVYARCLADAASAVVVSVDYRLAPEHRFPAAADDSFAAVRWVAANAASLGIDAARIGVAGDSAGGNLATVVCQMARDTGGPALAVQVLQYPTVDLTADTPSRKQFATGHLLTAAAMNWFAETYLNSAAERTDPRASPSLARDLSRLPPAIVVTAECDILRDEGKAYADKLAAAGVKTTYRCVPGVTHGFVRMGGRLGAANREMATLAAELKARFAAAG